MALLIAALFFGNPATRKLTVALIPFFLFGISYDWMNLCPNYKVNPIDTIGLYTAEKSLFGIDTAMFGTLTPNEFFGLWLYFKHRREQYLHFAIVFLLVNLIGFTFYYIHPAAPPWYVALHGFEPILDTPGDVAGLGAFDRMTGWGIFHGLYARNSNIFAALPSLHSAYTLVALIYAVHYRVSRWWTAVLAIITLGIWFTAVYTSHHYIIDVLAGIACALCGYLLMEKLLMRLPAVSSFIRRYTAYIS